MFLYNPCLALNCTFRIALRENLRKYSFFLRKSSFQDKSLQKCRLLKFIGLISAFG